MKLRIHYYDEKGNQAHDDYTNAIGIYMDHVCNVLTVLLGTKTAEYQMNRVYGIENARYLDSDE